MKRLNSNYTSIIWGNVVLLAGGIGFMMYKKFDNIFYGLGAALAIGTLEYVVMYFSLLKKQQKEEERHNGP